MVLKHTDSTLKRKLARAREAGQNGDRSALRALRQALGRAARDLMGLPVSVIGATQSRVGNDDLGHYLDDDGLMILLEGGDGCAGAAILDLTSVVAIIQQQTMGTISQNPPAPRGFTETDAALAAPLVELLLERAADLAQVPEDRLCLQGYRFGARAAEAASLALALEAEQFRVFELVIDIAAGQHQGSVVLILPDKGLPEPDLDAAMDGAQDGPNLGPKVMGATAELTAVLCRFHLPLSQLSKLRPGDLVPLPVTRLDQTELRSITGQGVAAGRLGQAEGYRAIRVLETVVADREPGLEDDMLALEGEDSTLHAARLRARREKMADDAELEILDGDIDALPGHNVDPPLPDPAAEDTMDDLSPDQAAAEISELAGLTFDESTDAELQNAD